MAVRADVGIVSMRPGGEVNGLLSPLLGDIAKFVVTGQAELGDRLLAAGHSHRAGASDGLNDRRGGKTLAVIAEFRQQRRA